MLNDGVKVKIITVLLLKKLSLIYSDSSGNNFSKKIDEKIEKIFPSLDEQELIIELRKILSQEKNANFEITSKPTVVLKSKITIIKTISSNELQANNFSKQGRKFQCKWCKKMFSVFRLKNHSIICKKRPEKTR